MELNPILLQTGRDLFEVAAGAIAALLAPKLTTVIAPLRPSFRLASVCWPLFDKEIASGKLGEQPFAQLAEQVVRQAAEGSFSEDQVKTAIGFLVKQFSAIAHDRNCAS